MEFSFSARPEGRRDLPHSRRTSEYVPRNDDGLPPLNRSAQMTAFLKYKVLLTRQKTQKSKRWTEGYLIEGEHGMHCCYLSTSTGLPPLPPLNFLLRFHFSLSIYIYDLIIDVFLMKTIVWLGSVKLYDENMKLLDSDFRGRSKVQDALYLKILDFSR